MAEPKKEESKSPDNPFLTYLPVILLFGLFIIGARLGGVTIFGEKLPEDQIAPVREDTYDVLNLLERDALSLGSRAINTKEAVVRTSPAGAIVGTQKKLETGRLLEGPISQFNTIWWRVDYMNAPDGWVQYDSLSPNIKTVRALNIVPILYNFYKPIGYSFLFILILLLIYFKLMLKKEERISEKKKRLKDEQYQEPEKSMAQRLAEKSAIEVVPGFQTEEIIPARITPDNGRWSHIQDLLKSYNVNDLRQAIIEADIMLEEMLDKMGYEGISIGDKLKNVEKSDFVTLDKAWSAHRVRNQIAHDGSSFKLSRELAEKTIKDFEEVFREFYYI